jgi:hypothetical protein
MSLGIFTFGGTGVLFQNLMLAKQVLYHLRPHIFALVTFEIGPEVYAQGVWTMIPLFTFPM